MTGRSTMLPGALIVVICLLTLIAILSGRSNAPDIAGNDRYPHHVCTFSEYCEGDNCTREPSSFVIYLEHVDTNPRLELARSNPRVRMEEINGGIDFTTTGGEVSGTLSLYPARNFNWVATSGSDSEPVEHYGTGECERLVTP